MHLLPVRARSMGRVIGVCVGFVCVCVCVCVDVWMDKKNGLFERTRHFHGLLKMRQWWLKNNRLLVGMQNGYIRTFEQKSKAKWVKNKTNLVKA